MTRLWFEPRLGHHDLTVIAKLSAMINRCNSRAAALAVNATTFLAQAVYLFQCISRISQHRSLVKAASISSLIGSYFLASARFGSCPSAHLAINE